MDVEVILISELPLPFSKVASWTNMYNYLLNNKTHKFNHIICPEVETKAKNVSYQFLRKVSVLDRVNNKLLSKSVHNNYLEALDKIVQPEKKYIIQIIDNSGIVVPLNNHIKENFDRKDFYIQYYFQGFAPIVTRKKGKKFLYGIDEFFFLTQLSYKEYLSFYDDCPFKARIVYNAIDLEKFKSVSISQKRALRQEESLNDDETVFIWCSQDRPKKGMHIVLEAFETIHTQNSNTRLLIVGVNRDINQAGVKIIGRVPNHELPKYYQMSDVYLFPSLWKEGFGIVLAEAMHCGCYIIASDQGGIKEVVGQGEYGVLIDNPNIVSEWIIAMNNAITDLKEKGNTYKEHIPKDLYSLDLWCNEMNQIVEEAKQKLKS